MVRVLHGLHVGLEFWWHHLGLYFLIGLALYIIALLVDAFSKHIEDIDPLPIIGLALIPGWIPIIIWAAIVFTLIKLKILKWG
jgi:hypothetical protein